MKKFCAIVLTLMLIACLAAPIYAAEPQTQATELSFTYKPAEPSYTVSIPGELAMEFGYNKLAIEVSDMGDLGNKVISVTVSDTFCHYHYTGEPEFTHLIPALTYHHNAGLEVPDNKVYSILYDLYDSEHNSLKYDLSPDKEYPEVTPKWAVPKDMILAKFAKEGMQIIQLKLDENTWEGELLPDVVYTGTIEFGIKLS